MPILKKKKQVGKSGKSEGLHAPWSVQLELTEGCNRLCTFCGLNGIREAVGQPYHFMGIEVAELTAKQLAQLCPNARVEFAMHGEPTLHPEWEEIIGLFRRYLPNTQFQLTTNGRTWMRDKKSRNPVETHAMKAFDAGIDIVILDTYEPERTKLQQLASEVSRVKVLDFYDECIPQGISPYYNYKRKITGLIIVMDDIGIRSGESGSRTLMNHAGNAADQPIPDEPYSRTCTQPFREITVCYNGNVNICCMDWGHEYTCGNVKERTLHSIWWGPEFTAARKFLQQKERGFSPCDRCNAKSGTRAGLLPKLSLPNKADLETVENVHNKPQRNKLSRKIWPSLKGKVIGG
jgi:radical SAM protein with 4Fe4S-binding SPASM domain